ncbi:MAG TPA: hypothetical protein DHW40_04585 [Microbacterium sp.]|nr:hypothetical protein [Microbacterium sp.]
MIDALRRQRSQRLGTTRTIELSQPIDHSIAMIRAKAPSDEMDHSTRLATCERWHASRDTPELYSVA